MKQEFYEKRNDVLLDAIKPAIEQLEEEKLIQTFHFLFEPHFEILLRVRLCEEASVERVKGIVDEKLKPIKDLCSEIVPEESYLGEGDPQAGWSFGTEGWAHTQKFLEYGSRITFLMREVEMGRKPLTAGRLDSQFNMGKLVHCFLNQAGMGAMDEAHFHIDGYFERMLMVSSYHDILEKLKKIEKQMG